eukprot:SAG31_NODE_3914_length_3756_cov_1.638228_6_plen_65_part_00
MAAVTLHHLLEHSMRNVHAAFEVNVDDLVYVPDGVLPKRRVLMPEACTVRHGKRQTQQQRLNVD